MTPEDESFWREFDRTAEDEERALAAAFDELATGEGRDPERLLDAIDDALRLLLQ